MAEKAKATQRDLYEEWANDKIPVNFQLREDIPMGEGLIICVADDYLIFQSSGGTVAIPFSAVLYVAFDR